MGIVLNLPILYNVVLWPGVKTSIFGGLAVISHYHQVSTRLYTVPHIQVIIETNVYWIVLVSIGCGKCCTFVEVQFEGEIPISHYTREKSVGKIKKMLFIIVIVSTHFFEVSI